jgi:hypothetical protein
MTTIRYTSAILLTGLAVVALSAPARADKIDGEWCFASQSLQIDGPSIRTPGGNQIKGDYSRHNFSYVVPSSEPEAGAEIAMQLLSEEAMTLSRRKGGKPEETWRRCKVTS